MMRLHSASLLLIFVIAAAAVVYLVSPKNSSSLAETPEISEQFFRGKVLNIKEEIRSDEDPLAPITQTAIVRIESGEEAGRSLPMAYEYSPGGSQEQKLETNDRVVVGKTIAPDGQEQFYVNDLYRLRSLWIIGGLFVLLTILFGGRKGFLALIGLLFSFFVITVFILPRIVNGAAPLTTSMIGALLIGGISIVLAHGWERRTRLALLATLITIALSFGIAWLLVALAGLSGIGSEEAFYLRSAPTGPIDLRGLLLGGILIGMLGILDDVTTTQTATIEEIRRANPALGFTELFTHGMSVGREHVSSLVNTLALAYTGASLPLLLLFTIYPRPIWVTLNSEIMMEEIVRTLSGSISLLIAVPLTTVLAAYAYSKK